MWTKKRRLRLGKDRMTWLLAAEGPEVGREGGREGGKDGSREGGGDREEEMHVDGERMNYQWGFLPPSLPSSCPQIARLPVLSSLAFCALEAYGALASKYLPSASASASTSTSPPILPSPALLLDGRREGGREGKAGRGWK